MSIAAFDTHAAVTALREAGFDERQAEGVVATVRDAVAEGVATRADVAEVKVDLARLEDKMATKADVTEVKADVAEVKVDLAEVKAELKADVARLETRMFLGILTAVGTIVALVKLLP